ncbi:MAG: DUF6706 family protein [Chitinophagaceae bacterium]
MTNKEALQEVLQVTVSDTSIEKAFLDASDYALTTSATYTTANEQGVDWIAVKLLENFLDADIDEGGYSIKYKDSIVKKIGSLKEKWGFGLTDEMGVQDASYLW